MKRSVLLPVLAALCLLLMPAGCVNIYNKQSLERQEESRYDDAGIKTSIGSALLKKDAAKANDINVHCFKGHVFLVGEADKEFRAQALDIARNVDGVVHVTTHWFPSGTASAGSDTAVEEAVVAVLPQAVSSPANRISVDVWGGHVVLTGLAAQPGEVKKATARIKKIDGVKSVTSYVSAE